MQPHRTTKANRRARQEALRRLGGKCRRCGFADYRALQIDHVNGGGAREHWAISATGIINKIRAGNLWAYQLLCANCNWIKRFEQREAKNGYGFPKPPSQ